jgi:hypothetical protein
VRKRVREREGWSEGKERERVKERNRVCVGDIMRERERERKRKRERELDAALDKAFPKSCKFQNKKGM